MTKKLRRRRVEPTGMEPKVAPIGLGALAWAKLKHQEGRFANRAHLLDKLLEDAVAAAVTLDFDLLQDLLGAERVAFQKGNDLALERIKLAGTLGALALLVTG